MATYRIAVIPGDGIGPEIVTEALKVLEKVGQKFGHEFLFTHLLMGGAAYNSLVNITRLSDVVAAAFASSNLDGLPLMLLIFALFFVMGMFLDTTPIIMIAIPILLPVIQASSLDTSATILILCITLCLGMITPPFGINMFYLQGVAPPGIDTKVMYKAVIPYVIIFLIACFFMMLFPNLLVLFPNSVMGY